MSSEGSPVGPTRMSMDELREMIMEEVAKAPERTLPLLLERITDTIRTVVVDELQGRVHEENDHVEEIPKKKMEAQIDFLQWLHTDILKVLGSLDDSADLIRASAVSRHWQNIVISNGLSKKLCMKRFPQLASLTRVIELNRNLEPAGDDPATNGIERVVGERDHQAYASLLQALTSFPQTYCIADPVSASSTDNYPEESIMNTLDPRDKILHRDSYWSSKGSDNPDTPETLIYKLTANFCVITEIYLHPFQALFQLDFPIYSSRFVRFRMGHPKCWNELERDFMEAQECADDKFIWTYTSKMFPVAKENRLQRFELPEPVVCVGGYMQVELLGRVQKQDADGKYYICVAHVQALGRQLSPAFCAEFSQPSNAVSLKYDAGEFVQIMQSVCRGHNGSLSTSLLPVAWGNLQDFMHIVQVHQNGAEHEWVFDNEFEMDGDDEIDPIVQAHQNGAEHELVFENQFEMDGDDEIDPIFIL